MKCFKHEGKGLVVLAVCSLDKGFGGRLKFVG